MRTLLARAALGLSLLVLGPIWVTPAAARPFTLDDLLKLERFDQAQITPDGRRLIVQTEAPYETASRFDFDEFGPPLLGRVKVASLAPASPAHDLLPVEPGAGYVAGPLSPSGRSMIIQRLKGEVWDTGIVDLASGQVRWLGVPTETAVWGRSLQWRSETQLVALALPPGVLPQRLRTIRHTTQRLAALWATAAAEREPTASVVGSGPDLALWPPPRAMRLVMIDVTSGQVRELAQGGFIDLELSPDGRFVAALADAEAEQPAASDVVRVGTPGRRRALTLVDLTTGAARAPLPDQDLLSHLLAWSPTGDHLLVFGRERGAAWADGALLEVTATSGAVARPARGQVIPDVAFFGAGLGVVRAAWLGDQPIVFGRPAGAATARADWFRLAPNSPLNLTAALPAASAQLAGVGPREILLIAAGAAYSVDPAGRAHKLAAAPGLAALALPRFGEGDRFAVNDPPRNGSWMLADGGLRYWDGQDLGRRRALPAQASAVAVAGDQIASLTHDDRGVETLSVGEGALETPVATINAPLAKVDPMPVRAIAHHSPDGRPLTSWLYLPARPAADGRPPLIVLPYPGSAYPRPPGRYAPDALVFTPNARLLTAHGYAVLAPSLPRGGPPGEPAQDLAAEILTAVDAVLAQGLADPHRLALWGHSFGGYGALITVAQTQRFRAVVAQAGETDLAAGWGNLAPSFRVNPEDGPMLNAAIGWTETGQASLGVAPWRDPDRYRRNSPFFLADQIHTPVFLIQGDQDFVALAHAEALFAALYRQGRAARLMTLFGEGHTVGSPANVRAVYGEVLPWLDQQLGAPGS